MGRVVILFVLLHIWCYCSGEPYFRKDYVYNSDFASFYKLHTVRRSWTDAKTRCQREGGELFFPETKAEADVAVALMKENTYNYSVIWIGVSDIISEGDFTAVNGQPIDEIFSTWEDEEPNDYEGNEDCVVLTSVEMLNDHPCSLKYPFICKKTLQSMQWNVLCDLPDNGYQYSNDFGKCYKFHLKPTNWTEAQSICSAEQSYLAVINSQTESDHLVKMIAAAPTHSYNGPYLAGVIHLGFHNHFGEGFTTVNGVPLESSGFSKWATGQPNRNGNELCGAMVNSGGISDVTCDSVCFYICEHDLTLLSSAFDERFGSRAK